MQDKAMYMIIFMYALSFSLIGGQYVADSIGITLTNEKGENMKSFVLDNIGVDALNQHTLAVNTGVQNKTAVQQDPVSVAAGTAYEVFQLMVGMYIFNVMTFFGVPFWAVSGIQILYVILLSIFLIAKIRGI